MNDINIKYKSMLSTQPVPEISIELLIGAVKALDPKISKAAYMMKKYQHSLTDGHEAEFQLYIGQRNMIVKAAKGKYTLEQMRAKAETMENKYKPTIELLELLVSVIQKGNYSISTLELA